MRYLWLFLISLSASLNIWGQSSSQALMISQKITAGGSPTVSKIGSITGFFGSPYIVTVTGSAASGSCNIVAAMIGQQPAGPVTVTDSGSNTYPSGSIATDTGNNINAFVSVSKLTASLTSGVSTVTITPTTDGYFSALIYNVSTCAASSIVDQTVTSDVSGSDTPATGTLTPSTSPTEGFAAFTTVDDSSNTPTCGNIMGAAATPLDLLVNASTNKWLLTCTRHLSSTTAGTATATSTGGWNWAITFVNVKN